VAKQSSQWTIQIHQLRVCTCPDLLVGFYWYGGNCHSAGSVPRWIDKLTLCGVQDLVIESNEEQGQNDDDVDDSARELESGACNNDKSPFSCAV